MRRSWLDWLTDLVDAAPGPRWLVYGASLAIWTLLTAVVGWSAEIRPFPDVVPSPVFAAMFAITLLWSKQVLDRVAMRSLEALNPALDLEATAIDELARELRRTPPGWASLVVPLGLAAGIAGVLANPDGWELRQGDPAAVWALTIGASCAALIAALGFGVHAVHQLRLVDDIHRRSVTIDLFRLEPLYAFARLTSLTGMTLVGIVVGGTLVVSIVVPNLEFAPTDIVTFGFLLLVAVACFIVPLLGLHDRIEAEKDRRLAEAQATLAAALAEVRRRIVAGDVDGAAKVNDAVAAANMGVLVVTRTSTWPWRAETLRGFLSAVLLPVLLWFVITLLGRFLPA